MLKKKPSTQHRPDFQPGVVRPRIYLGAELMLGPGKVDLLKAVGVTGSISSAARSLGMSYKRAWLLIDTLNQGFGRRVLVATHGGKGGGGTELTPLGKKLIERYESIERACTTATKVDVQAITHLLNAKK